MRSFSTVLALIYPQLKIDLTHLFTHVSSPSFLHSGFLHPGAKSIGVTDPFSDFSRNDFYFVGPSDGRLSGNPRRTPALSLSCESGGLRCEDRKFSREGD